MNILLVDDEPLVLDSLKLLLSIDRHQVTLAAGGHEALLLFNSAPYDLVILDYLMPDMLGVDLANNIRQMVPTQPIIILTAYQEQIVDYGKAANAVIGKPVSIDQLRTAVSQAIK